ncbi:MAG: alpha/beta fold hydrolase [Acidobacteriota bacterium]
MKRTPLTWLTAAALLCAAPPAAFAQGTVDDRAAVIRGEKTLRDCHIANYRQELLCGTHRVFEDREAQSGRELDIHFAIVPAVGDRPDNDPVVVFAGGPGQAAMSLVTLARLVFEKVLESRDVVLIDQRGIGASAPLTCELPDLDLDLPPSEIQAQTRELLKTCADGWDADVSLYTQDIANADIHEILRALGYRSVNLFGGSWGTRSALLYAHRYPDHVRSVVLDGALPLDNPAPLYAAEDAERALGGLLSDCAEDAACHKAFPDLEGDLDRALARLDAAGGEPLRITLNDPLTGMPQPATLDREVFGGLLRAVLYAPELGRMIPWLIHRAAVGDYRPLLGSASFLTSSISGGMTFGAQLAIFCAEEIPRASGATPAPAPRIGLQMWHSISGGCDALPPLSTPAIYSEAVRSSAPALILSGDRDPITPPRWGDAMAEAFDDAVHLTAPFTGHNVSPVGCAPELITTFVETADTQAVDGSCLDDVTRPSFFINSSGPDNGGAQ